MPKPVKLIHIHAKCDAFEIFEVLPESKAVNRLIKIRENFTYIKERGMTATQKRNRSRFRRPFLNTDNLIVKTRVVNPELQFH